MTISKYTELLFKSLGLLKIEDILQQLQYYYKYSTFSTQYRKNKLHTSHTKS